MKQLTNKQTLYNFIFWFNPYEDLWYVIDRDTLLDFFGGNREKSLYYRSSDVDTLVLLVTKDGAIENAVVEA